MDGIEDLVGLQVTTSKPIYFRVTEAQMPILHEGGPVRKQ